MKDHRNGGAHCERKRGFIVPCFYCNVLILLLLSLLVTCAPAWAADVVYTVTKVASTNEDISWSRNDGMTGNNTLAAWVKTVSVPTDGTVTINVGDGEYILSETLILKKGVKLKGAGAENTTLTRDVSGPDMTIVTCDGTWGGSGVTPDNTLLSGFTVTGGSTTTNGGGMVISNNANPAVENCVFSGNTAKISSTTMANINGGGMYIEDASPKVTNCTFVGNSAEGVGSAVGFGGGMFIKGGSPVVTNCTFADNTAKGYLSSVGGGMFMADAGVGAVVMNCTFADNKAEGYNSRGGGMYVEAGATPTVVNTILWGNKAADNPAIYEMGSSTVTLKNCALPTDGTNLSIPADCVTVNPRLVSCDAVGNTPATSADIRYYKLSANSSAIGRGLAVGTKVATVGGEDVVVPDKDQLGRARFETPDIGAWESGEPDPAPAPAPSSGPASGPASGPDAPTSANPLGATLTPTSGGTVSGDRLLVDVPSGGSLAVTLRVTGWKDPRGNPVTPYQVRALVGGVERKMTQLDAETFVLTLTPADLDKPLVLQGHIAGDQWVSSQGLTVTQSSAVSPTPTPDPDPADPSDPGGSAPSPTPDQTPSDPTTPDPTPEASGSSGGGCQAMGFAQGLFALAAWALLRRK